METRDSFFWFLYLLCHCTLWESSDLQNMTSQCVLASCCVEVQRVQTGAPKAPASAACAGRAGAKAGFHFLDTHPSDSIPPTEWLFITGFVFLIFIGFFFFGFLLLRHVYHMLPAKSKFQKFSKCEFNAFESFTGNHRSLSTHKYSTYAFCTIRKDPLRNTTSAVTTLEKRSLVLCWVSKTTEKFWFKKDLRNDLWKEILT